MQKKNEQKKTLTIHSPCFNFSWTEIPHNIYRIVFVLCFVDPNCSESSSHVETIMKAALLWLSTWTYDFNTDLFEWDKPVPMYSIWLNCAYVKKASNDLSVATSNDNFF